MNLRGGQFDILGAILFWLGLNLFLSSDKGKNFVLPYDINSAGSILVGYDEIMYNRSDYL